MDDDEVPFEIPFPTDWCHVHYKVEPVTFFTYYICYECGHAFTYLGLWWKSAMMASWSRRDLLRRSTWRRLLRRPHHVWVCPECAHDF